MITTDIARRVQKETEKFEFLNKLHQEVGNDAIVFVQRLGYSDDYTCKRINDITELIADAIADDPNADLNKTNYYIIEELKREYF